MTPWQLVGWCIVCLIGIVALYWFHRLMLWLEERGHVYYLHRKPSGSSAGAFVAMQRLMEPQSQHVEQVRHVVHRVEEDESGDSKPPG